MRKTFLGIFSFLLVMLTTLSSFADITVKVNDTGIGVLQFDGGDGSPVTFTESVNYIAPNVGDIIIGTLQVPNNYSMTVTNETRGQNIDTDEYDGYVTCSIHPGFASATDVLNVVVTGGGGEPVLPTVTFLFNPEGCAYIATAHYDNGIYVEDEVYNTPDDEGAIIVPYKEGTYLVKPNAGFTLTKALNESETNPHYNGDTPNSDGIIYLESGSFKAGHQFVVFATQPGSFTVRGVGSNVSAIQMMNNSTYSNVTVTNEAKTVNFSGAVNYSIYSGNSARLWKVEVTNDDETTLLSGNFGNFEYTPNNGDEVVIYTDRPETHAKIKVSFTGEGVDKNIVNSVQYDGEDVEESTWTSADGWDVVAGKQLQIKLNSEGFVNLSCSVNNISQSLGSSYSDNLRTLNYSVENEDETNAKEINVVISARKEKDYSVTLICDHPEAVTVMNESRVAFNFTSSPTVISVPEGAAQISIRPNNGWKVDGISVEEDPDAANKFVYGLYEVPGDCHITINVTNLAEQRTKTAVVYVDETVANPTYLSFKFQDASEQTIVPGYNFVKYCDEDLPFSFGYYAGGSAVFVVNDVIITGSTNPCAETIDFEDGGVIKYFNNTPVPNVVSYDLSDEIKDIVEIWHDHQTKIDFSSATEYACYPGTMLHIKPVSAPANAHIRAAAEVPFEVAVNDEKLTPDSDGVYSYKVSDGEVNIKVAKQITTGVESIEADNCESAVVYNLQGIAVNKNASAKDLKTLPAGVYVINGKKVVVK
ncbi:MAG: hypothetical protein K2L89_01660 [Muribaculaceae bacterium]|nr:hypothetical protein [Muribaculaceae bacterium]